MAATRSSDANKAGQPGAAFLLAQLGAHAASRFAERLAAIDLAPAHAGILRMLGTTPGMTQRELAAALGALPSRLLPLLDDLEARGLVERRQHAHDRRRHALCLSEAGQARAADIARIAREHQAALLAALTNSEQASLAAQLQRVADQQGLLRHAHPGYRAGGRRPRSL